MHAVQNFVQLIAQMGLVLSAGIMKDRLSIILFYPLFYVIDLLAVCMCHCRTKDSPRRRTQSQLERSRQSTGRNPSKTVNAILLGVLVGFRDVIALVVIATLPLYVSFTYKAISATMTSFFTHPTDRIERYMGAMCGILSLQFYVLFGMNATSSPHWDSMTGSFIIVVLAGIDTLCSYVEFDIYFESDDLFSYNFFLNMSTLLTSIATTYISARTMGISVDMFSMYTLLFVCVFTVLSESLARTYPPSRPFVVNAGTSLMLALIALSVDTVVPLGSVVCLALGIVSSISPMWEHSFYKICISDRNGRPYERLELSSSKSRAGSKFGDEENQERRLNREFGMPTEGDGHSSDDMDRALGSVITERTAESDTESK